jgi:hypothetical protein
MKTLNDLIELVSVITKNNENKLLEYCITLDMRMKAISLHSMIHDGNENEHEAIFSYLSFRDTYLLQQAYWTLFNECGNRVNK